MVLPVAALMMGLGVKRKLEEDAAADEERAAKLKRDEEDRAYTIGQRDRTLREQARADQLQTSMLDAAKPTAVESGESYQPAVDDEGYAMPANPTAGTFKAAGQRFADEGAAKKAADAYNSPVATMRRQAGVLTGAGKTGDAVTLTKQADAFEADESLKQVGQLMMQGGWDAVPEIYSRYNDGMSARVEKNDKGGATVIQVDDKTGKEVGRREFEDLPHLFASIAGRFDPNKWMADQQRRDEKAEGKRRWDAEQSVREKNADSQALVRAAQAEAAGAKAQASMVAAQAAMERAKGATATTAETPDSTFDMKTATDIAKDMVKKEAEDASLAGTKMSGAQVAKRVDEIVLALKQTHTNRFVAGQVQRVLTMAQSDPAAYAQEYDKALKLLPQSELARMGFAPPAVPGAVKLPATAADAGQRTNLPATSADAGQKVTMPAGAPQQAAKPVATMANTAGQDKVLQEMQGQNRQVLDGLAQEVSVAKQQLAAVTKSGDPAALARYAQAVTAATEKLKAEAAKRLGNNAPAYLQSVL